MATDIWKHDLLDRKWDAEHLYRLAIGRNEENVRKNKGSFVLNIDAPWGQGKSFFLNAVYETVRHRRHPAVFINAWQFDFIDDPFAICVAALDRYFKSIQEQKEITKTEKFREGLKTVRSQFLNITWTLGKAVVKKAINKVAENGVDEVASIFESNEKPEDKEKNFADEMAEAITDEMKLFSDAAIDKFAQRQIDSINETQESLATFQKGLGLIIEAIGDSQKHKLPMFVFIDELDRCRPTYAIAMLERIKHIFDVPNVVFVLATDTESLSHSIKAVYGAEFKSREYLGRFFNRTYKLPQPSNEKIVLSMLVDRGSDLNKWAFPTHHGHYEEAAIFLNLTASVFGLEIRPLQQAIEVLMDVTSAWNEEYPIELTYLFTLICSFIKFGRISEQDRVKPFYEETDWRFSEANQKISYREVFNRVEMASKSDIAIAFNDADTLLRTNGNLLNTYLHNLIMMEYRIADRDNKTKQMTSFSRYEDLILHARQLL